MISYPLLIVCALAGSAVGAWLGIHAYMPLILRLAGKHKEGHKNEEV